MDQALGFEVMPFAITPQFAGEAFEGEFEGERELGEGESGYEEKFETGRGAPVRHRPAFGERAAHFDEVEVLASELPKTSEVTKRSTTKRPGPPTTCATYEKGEVQKSWTAQGHLSSDVFAHARGLLIADFGVDWRTPRESLKREKALQDWLGSILQLVRDNPTTVIRILGFSDCVGNERNNRALRRGRAVRIHALLHQMLGPGARWSSIKAAIKLIDAAPAGDYVSSNATVEGRAQNRSVLIEYTRRIDYAPQVVQPCIVRPSQAATYALLGVIPNVPNYPRNTPVNYRLNAKKIVGVIAQDLSSKGKSAHFWVELAHSGLMAAEIFAEGSLLVAGLAIAGPLLAVAGSFLALGAGYYEAAEKIAEEWSATGFSRGVVMGAEGRKAKLLKDYFGNACCPPNRFFEKGRDIAIANYRMGLLVGYVQGRLLCPNQRIIFWRDLGVRIGDQSYRGPSKQWTARGWVNWYIDAAAAFKSAHL